jgi:hypothetical protein
LLIDAHLKGLEKENPKQAPMCSLLPSGMGNVM